MNLQKREIVLPYKQIAIAISALLMLVLFLQSFTTSVWSMSCLASVCRFSKESRWFNVVELPTPARKVEIGFKDIERPTTNQYIVTLNDGRKVKFETKLHYITQVRFCVSIDGFRFHEETIREHNQVAVADFFDDLESMKSSLFDVKREEAFKGFM